MIVNRQRQVRVALPPLADFLDRVRRELSLNGRELSVCLVSDAAMAKMNESFRGKHGPTDVLSFPAGAAVATDTRSYIGDIAISPQTARRNARHLGRALPDELRILILHGVLHLLGYDHETDRGQMERLEMRLRHRLGLS